MNSNTENRLAWSVALLVGSSVGAFAQYHTFDSTWHVGLGYRALFNVRATFENRGLPTAAHNPSANGLSYNDGFVGTDATGNALGLTSYWGYQNGRQVAGDAVNLRNSKAGGLGQEDDLAGSGLELVVGRELGGERLRWGVEGAFNFTQFDAGWSGTPATTLVSMDAYPLGGIVPPTAPYTGPMTPGPGSPLLGTTATTLALPTRINFDTSLYGFRLGPYVEYPLCEYSSISAGAGLSLAVVNSQLDSYESPAAPYTAAGQVFQDSTLDVVFGGYVSAQLNVFLSRNWAAYTGVQFSAMQDFEHQAVDKVATLELGSAFAWFLGVQYRF